MAAVFLSLKALCLRIYLLRGVIVVNPPAIEEETHKLWLKTTSLDKGLGDFLESSRAFNPISEGLFS